MDRLPTAFAIQMGAWLRYPCKTRGRLLRPFCHRLKCPRLTVSASSFARSVGKAARHALLDTPAKRSLTGGECGGKRNRFDFRSEKFLQSWEIALIVDL